MLLTDTSYDTLQAWQGASQCRCTKSPVIIMDIPEPAETVLLINKLSCSPTSAANIRTWTSKDLTLAQVLRATLRRWPEGTLNDPELAP